MSRRRRLPRHLLEEGPEGRTATAPGAQAATGPVATAWLAALDAAMVPATAAMARRRLSSAHTRRVTLVPGSVRAEVRQDSYRNQLVEIAVPQIDEAGWDRLLDSAAAHGRWMAALAAGVLPDDLAIVLLEAGLAPDGRELEARCTCRPAGGMCVHAGIAGLVAARALARSPGDLLILRGALPARARERIVVRLPGGGGDGAIRDPAMIDWNLVPREPVRMAPGPLPPPQSAVRPEPIPAAPGTGIDTAELDDLAADAAERALEMLTTGGDGALDLDPDADLGRRCAQAGARGLERIAAGGTRTAAELEAMGSAWRIGGAAAVAALVRPWRPAPRLLDPGLAALRALGVGAQTRMNRVIGADRWLELVYGRDGLWYRLIRGRHGSPPLLAGPGAEDPIALLRGSGTGPHPAPAGPVEQLRLL